MKDINLLPEDLNKVEENEQAKPSGISINSTGIAVTLIILVLMIASLFAPKIYLMILESNEEALKSQLESSVYKEVRALDSQLASIDSLLSMKKTVIDDIDKKNISVAETILSIKNSVPKGCYITGIDYGANSIKISGYVENVIIMNEFMSNLTKIENFSTDGSGDSITYKKTNSAYLFNLTLKSNGKDGK